MPSSHDWSRAVDLDHLAAIRASPLAGGVTHLVLEVLAQADEEAAATGRTGRATITLHRDGSLEVADDGRGTDTRVAADGAATRKPVFSTPALAHWFAAQPSLLPDGLPRRGVSVVGAMSTWLVHANRRGSGSWTQRYSHGVPVSALVPTPDDATTGTSVRFLPAMPSPPLEVSAVHGFAHLRVTVVRA